MKILLIEDQPHQGSSLETKLNQHFTVTCIQGVEAGAAEADRSNYGLIIRDITDAHHNGELITSLIRKHGNLTPIFVLAEQATINDLVRVLEIGADDYFIKPINTAQLIARCHVVERRLKQAPQIVRKAKTKTPKLIIDPKSREVSFNNLPIELTRKEFDLLYYLVNRRGEVVTRQDLLENVWGFEGNKLGGSNIVDAQIKSLREKIDKRFGTELITTVRGVGYRINKTPRESVRFNALLPIIMLAASSI